MKKLSLILVLLLIPAIAFGNSLAPSAKLQEFNSSGEICSGCYLYTYDTGTTTPRATKVSESGSANTNPIILDSAGRANVWLDEGTYRFVLKESDNATVVYTVDGITSTELPTDPFTALVATGVDIRDLDGVINIGNRYMIDATEADQGANSSGYPTTLKTVKDYVDSIGGAKKAILVFTHSTSSGTTSYTFQTTEVISDNFVLEIQNGAILTDSGVVNLTIQGPIDAEQATISSWTGGGTLTTTAFPLKEVTTITATDITVDSITTSGVDITDLDGVINIGNEYIIDATEADQGALSSGYPTTLKTVKDYVDSLAGNEATLVFPHSTNAATTTYTFSTSETVPVTIHLVFKKGAIVAIDNAITVTLEGAIDAEEWPFTLTGTGTVDYSTLNLMPAASQVQPDATYETGKILQALDPGVEIHNGHVDLFHNLGRGLSFGGLSDTGVFIPAAGLIGKLRANTNELQEGELYFLVTDSGRNFAPMKLDRNGTLFLSPRTGTEPSNWDDIVTVDGARMVIDEADGAGTTTILELRQSTPNASVVGEGQGRLVFSMRNTNDDDEVMAYIRALTSSATTQGTTGEIDTRVTGRTDGSERSKVILSPRRGTSGATSLIDDMVIESDPDNTGTVNSPFMYQHKMKMYATGNANLTMVNKHCGALITNNGAKTAREIALTREDYIGNGYQVTISQGAVACKAASYKWTVSGSGTNEYYLEYAAGGYPELAEPSFLYRQFGDQEASGTAGSLTTGQWDFADNDALGWSTIYYRHQEAIAGAVTADPDTLWYPVLLTYPISVTPYNAVSGKPSTGIAITGSTGWKFVSDAALGTSMHLVYDKQNNLWNALGVVGTWTSYYFCFISVWNSKFIF